MEKNNRFPGMDRRAFEHEKRSQCEQGHPPHGFIADEGEGFRRAEAVYSGKNERK